MDWVAIDTYGIPEMVHINLIIAMKPVKNLESVVQKYLLRLVI
jgi:hypothetical protein